MFTTLLVSLDGTCQELTGLGHPTLTQTLRAPGLCTAHFSDSEQQSTPRLSAVSFAHRKAAEALRGWDLPKATRTEPEIQAPWVLALWLPISHSGYASS